MLSIIYDLVFCRAGFGRGANMDFKIGKGIMSDKMVEVLKMIAEDMKNDAKNFDGKPFNGKTVATYFGNQGAAIAVLANIVMLEIIKREGKK